MSKNQNEELSGKIKNMGMLDLTKLKSAEQIANIKAIENVGTVLVPESLMDEVMSIPMTNVGGTFPIPEGENVKVRTGQVNMSGESLAQGKEDAILIVVGQLVIESVCDEIGYKDIQIMGQLIAPKECESLIEKKLSKLTGQSTYYQGNLKLFAGEGELSRDFFELIEEPISLMLAGEYVITEEIPADLFKEKIIEVNIAGELKAPKKVISLIQFLSSSIAGELKVLENEEKNDQK